MKDFKDMTEEEISKIVLDSIREEYDRVSDEPRRDIATVKDAFDGLLSYHTDEYVGYFEGLLIAAFVEKAEAARRQGIL